MSQQHPAIVVDQVSHAYKGRRALRKVSFEVPAGVIHGFVGPNGAGKTTTLKIISTLLRPSAGQAKVFGIDVAKRPDQVRTRIGFMPDHFSMYRSMRVREYLDFFAAAYGLPTADRDRVISDVLALVDMDKRADDFIKGLSRGMQQRVCLARVLVHDPALLLLDEPASGLDPRARIELMEILKELCTMGKTIFISSHILAELAELCDTVTIMDRGEVRYSGDVANLLATRSEGEVGYLLEIDAAVEGLEEAIAALPGVDHCEELGPDEGSANRIGWRIAGPADIFDRGAVLRTVLNAGGQVYAFKEDQRRLGEAFMDLTTPGVRG
jgi:ABC-2 type transport system ATP-binding protein